MSEDLPPFFSPPENNGSDRELSSEQAKRPLTPAPSIEKSQESPAPMVVVRNQKSSIATALFAGLVVVLSRGEHVVLPKSQYIHVQGSIE